MNFIVAADEKWGIGKDNGLLFRIPGDLKYFKQKTSNKIVVMGEATLKSLPGGKPLSGRTNIVLSDDPAFRPEDVILARTASALFAELEKYPDDDIFIIGGASVYNQFMDYCKFGYVTKINARAAADKFLNSLDNRDGWRLKEQSSPFSHGEISYRFTVYENSNVLRRSV